jgi:site-specific recombinase XerC
MHYDEHLPDFLRFLRDEEGARPNTLRNYRQVLTRLGAARVPLERQALLKFIGEGRHGPVAPATRNWRLMTIRRFMRYLVREHLLAVDPAADLALVAVPRQRRAPVSLVGLRHGLKLLARRGAAGARDRALVTLFFQTGLRLSEVHGLHVHQVHLRHGLLVDVVRKGGHVADIHINDDAAQAVDAWLKVRGDAPGPLFPGSDATGTLARRTIQKRLERFGELAGVAGALHPHRLRHTYATELMRSGNATELIRILMDHSSIVTTQGYLHAADSDLRRAVRRMPRLHQELEPREVATQRPTPAAAQRDHTRVGNSRIDPVDGVTARKLRTEVDLENISSTALDDGDRTL